MQSLVLFCLDEANLERKETSVFYSVYNIYKPVHTYTLSNAWSGVNWADLMAAQGAFGTDFYDRSKLRPKHRDSCLLSFW